MRGEPVLEFTDGRSFAMTVPPHQWGQIVRFYRDTLGLRKVGQPLRRAGPRSVGLQFPSPPRGRLSLTSDADADASRRASQGAIAWRGPGRQYSPAYLHLARSCSIVGRVSCLLVAFSLVRLRRRRRGRRH